MVTLMTMEAIVAVAIGVLSIIFLASMLALIAVCGHRYCKNADLSKQQKDSSPDVNLVEHMEVNQEISATDVELDEVGLPENLEELLEDEMWVVDASGLAPHCLAILKTCKLLTDKLVGTTMGNVSELRAPETLNEIVTIAKRISPRVDDVVKSMYPPLDPRLLEARCTALVLSVHHLVFLTKSACRLSGVADWIDQSLADVEDNLKILREASNHFETLQSHPAQNEISEKPDIGLQSSNIIEDRMQHMRCDHHCGHSQNGYLSNQMQLNYSLPNITLYNQEISEV